MKNFALVLIAFGIYTADAALGCGSHGFCAPPPPPVPVGPVIGPRPLLVGGGSVAFRRANRLQRRANRAAFFGFFGRANRLQGRSIAAFNRGLFRNARFNGF